MSTADLEFLRMVRTDIDYFERAVKRFEELLPHVSAPLQDQWRLQAQVRQNFTTELEILLEKAERPLHVATPSLQPTLASDRGRN